MKRAKTYSSKEVYDATMLGFIFEFYCSKEPSFIVEDLKKISGKSVVITDQTTIKPSFSTCILVKEYDGKRPHYQFKIGEQKYNEVSTFLNTILFWINENASLDKNTLMKVNLNYSSELQTLTNISHMDVGKLILKMDENYVYQRFPEMKGCPFAASVKKIVPFNMSSNASNAVNLINEFQMPVDTFYGIDLTEQTKGELTFNYIGGYKYSEKVKEIYELLEYYVFTTYQVLNAEEYTSSMINELNKLTEEYRTFRKCYYKYDLFESTYKDFVIYIDLNKRHQLIETQWFQLRDHVAKLILESNLKKCKFNWDTEFGTFQIKDAEINASKIKGFQLVDCTINGIVENCHLWSTKLSNSRILNSTLVNGNKVSESYLQKVRADRENKIEESMIVNSGEIINCDLNGCIIKNAGLGDKAKLDENCLVISPKEKFAQPSLNGIEVKEIRDYKWIKSLRDPNYTDKGFANEYKDG